MLMKRRVFSPGDDSDWLSVDDGDVTVKGLGGVGLVVGGQEERCLHVFLKRHTVLHHVDVTYHWHCHPQVPAYTRSICQWEELPEVCCGWGGLPEVCCGWEGLTECDGGV